MNLNSVSYLTPQFDILFCPPTKNPESALPTTESREVFFAAWRLYLVSLCWSALPSIERYRYKNPDRFLKGNNSIAVYTINSFIEELNRAIRRFGRRKEDRLQDWPLVLFGKLWDV